MPVHDAVDSVVVPTLHVEAPIEDTAAAMANGTPILTIPLEGILFLGVNLRV